jgi:hypothetical protein
VAQEQVAALAQGPVHATHESAGRLAAEVDGDVAAQHQVDALADAERRRLGDEVVVAELHQLADLRAHAHPTGVRGVDGREEPRGVLGCRRVQRARAVAGLTRGGQGPVRDVGAEHGDVPAGGRGEQLAQDHRDRVGLLAGRAARAPDAQPLVAGGGAADQLGQQVAAQRAHLRRVAEEVRLLDGHLVEQLLDLREPSRDTRSR